MQAKAESSKDYEHSRAARVRAVVEAYQTVGCLYYHYDPVILAYLPDKTLYNQTKITISRRNYHINPGFPSQGKIEVMSLPGKVAL